MEEYEGAGIEMKRMKRKRLPKKTRSRSSQKRTCPDKDNDIGDQDRANEVAKLYH